MLLPVHRLHQLGEEGCQILVLVLVLEHAGRAGCGVEVHEFFWTESLKFEIVEHGGEVCLEPFASTAGSSSICRFILNVNGVFKSKTCLWCGQSIVCAQDHELDFR